jgi:hypothetical protein
LSAVAAVAGTAGLVGTGSSTARTTGTAPRYDSTFPAVAACTTVGDAVTAEIGIGRRRGIPARAAAAAGTDGATSAPVTASTRVGFADRGGCVPTGAAVTAGTHHTALAAFTARPGDSSAVGHFRGATSSAVTGVAEHTSIATVTAVARNRSAEKIFRVAAHSPRSAVAEKTACAAVSSPPTQSTAENIDAAVATRPAGTAGAEQCAASPAVATCTAEVASDRLFDVVPVATAAAIADQAGVASVARTPAFGDTVAAAAAVAEQQATVTAILTRASVGTVADQQAAVLPWLVAIADEDADDRTDEVADVTRRGQGRRARTGYAAEFRRDGRPGSDVGREQLWC